MALLARIRKGEYFDSVTLMTVGKKLAAMADVEDAAIVMGTKENRSILQNAGLLAQEFAGAGEGDLLIAVRAKTEAAADEAMKAADVELLATRKRKSGACASESRPRSLEAAVKLQPGTNMALISVAGRYAGAEAMKALEAGLHVMLFSDNVPLETEIELKRFAKSKGLLCMGPDCGTAIVNGAPLGFANAVARGSVGMVAAAGTGLQETSCIVSCEGAGVSQALGTGGRDVKKDVGGLMFIEGLKALARDDESKVLLLVSKPPHESVLKELAALLKKIKKPVVAVFLGAPEGVLAGTGALQAATLEEGALVAASLARLGPKQALAAAKARFAALDKEEAALAAKELKKPGNGRKYVRALYSGGTFCAEAQLIFQGKLAPLFSNAPAGGALKLEDSLKSRHHTVVDLGEDEFTVGRPHPMIDFSLRNRRILDELKDPEAAVILLDVVLGWGSNMKPAEELAPVVKQATERLSVVATVTGTEKDPQGKAGVVKALEEAGAVVRPSNASACRLALRIAGAREGK